MLNNIDVAILTTLNELARRYGLRPTDIVATVRDDNNEYKSVLYFEVPAQGNALREERYGKMLQALGVSCDGVLKGTDEHILDALDNALRHTPKRHLRF